MHSCNKPPEEFVIKFTNAVNMQAALPLSRGDGKAWERIYTNAAGGETMDDNSSIDSFCGGVAINIKSKEEKKCNIVRDGRMPCSAYQERFPEARREEMRRLESAQDKGDFLIDTLNWLREKVLSKCQKYVQVIILHTRFDSNKSIYIRIWEREINPHDKIDFKWEFVDGRKKTRCLKGKNSDGLIITLQPQQQIRFDFVLPPLNQCVAFVCHRQRDANTDQLLKQIGSSYERLTSCEPEILSYQFCPDQIDFS